MRLLFVPMFILGEGTYLFRHPWTFNWIAALVWGVVTGGGFLLFWCGKWISLSPFVFMGAVGAYYYLKVKLNRRRPSVMKRHREHYVAGIHRHGRWRVK